MKIYISNYNYMKNKIYLFCLLVVSGFLLAGCSKSNGGMPQMPPAQVSAYTVKTGNAVYYDNYPATVIALNQVELRPLVSGYLTDIYFKDGQHVTKGMKLYAIDQQQYEAAYEAAKANLERAKQDYARYQELAKNNAIATQVLEHSLADLKSAESNVSASETNYRNSVISAPFDGTIGISQVKLGSAVIVGQTLMNTISSNNPVAVDFYIDEKDISFFTNLLNKKTNSKDSTFTLLLPDQTIYPYPGQLILMDRAVDPATGTLTARLEFPNNKDLLKPGLTCNVRVMNYEKDKIIIPDVAVTVQMGEYFVFVIDSNKVSQRRVDKGRTIGDIAIINGGLNAGEQIVTEGVQNLHDGSPVMIAPPSKGSQKSN
jgi:RND family efflux transporter MFP subunit